MAYIFAHNNGDGDFGPNKDQDVIKCGVFSTDSSGNATVDLGFEPQWLMVKATNAAAGWEIYDQMRGFGVSGHAYLYAHLGNAEGNNTTAGTTQPTNTGFSIGNNYWGPGVTLIYMAIRRGPLAEPTDATKVFAIDTASGTSPSPPQYNSGFPVDMGFYKHRNSADDWYVGSRLTQGKLLKFNSTAAQADDSALLFDFQNGFNNANWTSTYYVGWMWKRAPSYFDVVTYTGTGSARTISHNLGAVPEMMWVKTRTGSTGRWAVYHKDTGNTKYLFLNDTDAAGTFDAWNNTTPTSSVFSLSSWSTVNDASRTYIAYLFATGAGVSKVGSYDGNGSNQNIDCGFSSGARFILIKSATDAGSWFVHDSARGIVAGNDPRLKLDQNQAEMSADYVDPLSSGFTVNGPGNNDNGQTYIFYAIA